MERIFRIWSVLMALALLASASAAEAKAGNPVVLNSNDFYITARDVEITESLTGHIQLRFELVIENKGTKKCTVVSSAALINDWDVEAAMYCDVNPGKKKKDTLIVNLDDADMTDASEIEYVELMFTINPEGTIDFIKPAGNKVQGDWIRQHVQ